MRLAKVRASLRWSTPIEVDESQGTGKQKTLVRSNTNPLTTEAAADGADASPPPRTTNVVLFGETGVGKSSVINLIARKPIAAVSSDVQGCTMHSTRYNISFDSMDFAIFDTIGLEEPQMGVNGYLKAIEKAYELIARLSAAGGVHLLLFCMRGGRITATTQSNYRLFCECLCSTKVPIALVFTGLEREAEMENWWKRNKDHIEHYGIKSKGHACITAVRDDTPGEDLKFTESQRKIRELVKECALKDEAFSIEPHTWFARFGRGMRSFIAKRRNPKKKDIMKILTQRCKLDYDTARKIVDMMEKDDTEMKEKDNAEMKNAQDGVTAENVDTNQTDTERADSGSQAVVRAGPSMTEGQMGQMQTTGAGLDEDDAEQDAGPPNQLDEDGTRDMNESSCPLSDQNAGDDESENFEDPRTSGMQEEGEDRAGEDHVSPDQHSWTEVSVADQRSWGVSAPVASHGDLVNLYFATETTASAVLHADPMNQQLKVPAAVQRAAEVGTPAASYDNLANKHSGIRPEAANQSVTEVGTSAAQYSNFMNQHLKVGVEVANERPPEASAPVAPYGDSEVRPSVIESGRKYAAKSTPPNVAPGISARPRKNGTTHGGEHAGISPQTRHLTTGDRWSAVRPA